MMDNEEIKLLDKIFEDNLGKREIKTADLTYAVLTLIKDATSRARKDKDAPVQNIPKYTVPLSDVMHLLMNLSDTLKEEMKNNVGLADKQDIITKACETFDKEIRKVVITK